MSWPDDLLVIFCQRLGANDAKLDASLINQQVKRIPTRLGAAALSELLL
jgi:hypothetical protein